MTHRLTDHESQCAISSDAMMDAAYAWVCKSRLESGHNNSIWDLRYNWTTIKPLIQKQLRDGQYFLSALQSYCINDEWLSSWPAMDAWVLKALSLTLQPLFTPEQYSHCTHLKDAGGIHAVLKQVSISKEHYQHNLKSDAYHFGALPTIAKASLEKHRAKLAQRYAQGASPACIGDYVARWTSWCGSALRASGTNHNKTNLLERCWSNCQRSMGSNIKESSDEKNTPCGREIYTRTSANCCIN